MKKILLLLALIVSFGFLQQASGQACAVSNVSVQLNSLSPSGSNCVVDVNLTFSLQHNSGNKFIWVHLWKTADYPNLPYNAPPTAAQLALSLANIGINNNVSPQTLQLTYVPATGVPVQSSANGLTLTVTPGVGVDIYTITGVKLTVASACNTAIAVKGDVWSTQSASQNNVQCFSKGLVFIANDPTITGFKRCTTPRTLSLGIQTTSVTDIHVSYTLYKDDGDGIFEPGTGDIQVGSGGPFTINSTTPYVNTSVTYTGNGAPGENSSIWVAVTSDEPGSSTVISLFQNQCSSLPVNLTYFNAKRSNANSVSLTWQTAQELNSSGFEIQRQIGNGVWQVVAFINSQAPNGNSGSPLTYSYIDNNNARGITEYRLREVDIDGNSKFSQIRSVRGEGQAGKIIVFPNPTSDGRSKVVFEDVNGTRDVSLADMSGRIIKQWSAVTNNNLEIDNLPPGLYSLRVIVRETGEQSVEKIIVNKR
jgi:hypothetical protein